MSKHFITPSEGASWPVPPWFRPAPNVPANLVEALAQQLPVNLQARLIELTDFRQAALELMGDVLYDLEMADTVLTVEPIDVAAAHDLVKRLIDHLKTSLRGAPE